MAWDQPHLGGTPSSQIILANGAGASKQVLIPSLGFSGGGISLLPKTFDLGK
jgi:hypothetical protein